MGKRQDAAQETRRKLLDALDALLKEKDSSEIAIEDITARAGVAKGSFYTYFKKKEDAICCISLKKYESVTIDSLKPSKDVVTNIGSYLKGSAKIIDKYTLETAQGWMSSAVSPSEGNKQGLDKYNFDCENIKKIINLAVEKGELNKSTPIENIATAIMNFYYGAVTNWCITKGESDLIKNIDFFCQDSLKTILDNYKN